MVNFRYHVVSLAAVFLALALGVILGAGPLQNQVKSISDGEDFQEQLAASQAELQATAEEGQQYATYVDALADELLPGALDGLKVVTVSMPGANAADVEQLVQAAELAGATVVGSVELTESWISLGQREYRETLSAPVASHLTHEAASETSDGVLAQALVEVISTTGSEQDLMRQILADETTPLVVPGTMPEEPATAAILAGSVEPLLSSDDTAEEEDQAQVSVQAVVDLANALGTLPDGAVAVGKAVEDEDLITRLRQADASITTVDQLGSQMAVVNAVLSLGTEGDGKYGQGIDALEPAAPLPAKK